MIKLDNNTVLRNLEEQVQYLTDYHEVNQGLVQWGIRVIGQVNTEADLPDVATYDGEYGDAYAVGTAAPYNFFIWTRSSVVGAPGYWFPFGQISIVGPKGPKGDKGDKGDRGESSKWISVSTQPTSVTGYKLNDMALNTNNGDVYRVMYLELLGNVWTLVGNIRGPQGIQGLQGPQGDKGDKGDTGEQGPQGDVGGFINIWGQLANINQLPTPASLGNLTAAYLVEHTGGEDQAGDHYDLYVQAGETSATAEWINAGPFNAATLVTSNGLGLNVWDADTKVDKVEYNSTDGSLQGRVYIVDRNNAQTSKELRITGAADSIPLRNANGNFYVGTPTIQYECANKGYVDEAVANAGGGLTLYNHVITTYDAENDSTSTIQLVSPCNEIKEVFGGYWVEGDPETAYNIYLIPDFFQGYYSSERIVYFRYEYMDQYLVGVSDYAYTGSIYERFIQITNYRIEPYTPSYR